VRIEESIDSVARILASDGRLAGALLFGSAARGRTRPGSDLDVAIAARSEVERRSLESGLLDLTASLSLAAGRDVEVVLLDTVDPVLGRQVLLHGRTMLERDPARMAALRERILREYFDGEYHRRMGEEALDRRLPAKDG
jgi:uncharacterized protein